jgi:hypothetical protein
MAFEAEKPNKARNDAHSRPEAGTAEPRRPYDTSDMDWAPKSEDGDPPYRDWWVVGQGNHE